MSFEHLEADRKARRYVTDATDEGARVMRDRSDTTLRNPENYAPWNDPDQPAAMLQRPPEKKLRVLEQYHKKLLGEMGGQSRDLSVQRMALHEVIVNTLMHYHFTQYGPDDAESEEKFQQYVHIALESILPEISKHEETINRQANDKRNAALTSIRQVMSATRTAKLEAPEVEALKADHPQDWDIYQLAVDHYTALNAKLTGSGTHPLGEAGEARKREQQHLNEYTPKVVAEAVAARFRYAQVRALVEEQLKQQEQAIDAACKEKQLHRLKHTPQPDDKRSIILVAGGAGTGKTSIVARALREMNSDCATLNPDTFKLLVADSNDGLDRLNRLMHVPRLTNSLQALANSKEEAKKLDRYFKHKKSNAGGLLQKIGEPDLPRYPVDQGGPVWKHPVAVLSDEEKRQKLSDMYRHEDMEWNATMAGARSLHAHPLMGEFTHDECSLIFDRALTRWRDNAAAPNLIMDIAKPDEWCIRQTLGKGGMKIYLGTLPADMAWDRAHQRVEDAREAESRDRRMMPTIKLWKAHRNIYDSLLNALQRKDTAQLPISIFDTAGRISGELAKAAEYDPHSHQLRIYRPAAMLHHFAKNDLNIFARNAADVWKINPDSLGNSVLSYARQIPLVFCKSEKDTKTLGSIHCDADGFHVNCCQPDELAELFNYSTFNYRSEHSKAPDEWFTNPFRAFFTSIKLTPQGRGAFKEQDAYEKLTFYTGDKQGKLVVDAPQGIDAEHGMATLNSGPDDMFYDAAGGTCNALEYAKLLGALLHKPLFYAKKPIYACDLSSLSYRNLPKKSYALSGEERWEHSLRDHLKGLKPEKWDLLLTKESGVYLAFDGEHYPDHDSCKAAIDRIMKDKKIEKEGLDVLTADQLNMYYQPYDGSINNNSPIKKYRTSPRFIYYAHDPRVGDKQHFQFSERFMASLNGIPHKNSDPVTIRDDDVIVMRQPQMEWLYRHREDLEPLLALIDQGLTIQQINTRHSKVLKQFIGRFSHRNGEPLLRVWAMSGKRFDRQYRPVSVTHEFYDNLVYEIINSDKSILLYKDAHETAMVGVHLTGSGHVVHLPKLPTNEDVSRVRKVSDGWLVIPLQEALDDLKKLPTMDIEEIYHTTNPFPIRWVSDAEVEKADFGLYRWPPSVHDTPLTATSVSALTPYQPKSVTSGKPKT